MDETVTKPWNPGLASHVWSANLRSMNSPIPAHDRTGDEVSAHRFRLMADKIEADPTLLEISLANIARWLGYGHSARTRLDGCRTMKESMMIHGKRFAVSAFTPPRSSA